MPALRLEELLSCVVPEAASKILRAAGGNQRQAEVQLWEWRKKFEPDSPSARFLVDVILCVTDGRELPHVPRQAYKLHEPPMEKTVAT